AHIGIEVNAGSTCRNEFWGKEAQSGRQFAHDLTKTGAGLRVTHAIPEHRCDARPRHPRAGGKAEVRKRGTRLFRAREYVVPEIAGRSNRPEQVYAKDRVGRRAVNRPCGVGRYYSLAAGRRGAHRLPSPRKTLVIPVGWTIGRKLIV